MPFEYVRDGVLRTEVFTGSRGDPCPNCGKRSLARTRHPHAAGRFTGCYQCRSCGHTADIYTETVVRAAQGKESRDGV